ncbi:MAG: MBL fold metallo-hydrolase [Firmicutes bacterium]|nr:MBL fold metallo-hydrolase [Bacillota bacterium]
MPGSIQISYLSHSGFAVRTRDTLLVFDDAGGKPRNGDSLETGHVTRPLIDEHQRTIFFVSHSHADHFSPAIYDFSDAGMVHYVLGDDLPERYSGYRMSPGDKLSLGGAEITAFDSTDEGVSFLVAIDGWMLFHAGDLNLWHWREESTLREIEQAERDYEAAVRPLENQPIDIAFFPLDPRMGEMYDAGALHFLMSVKPRVMIPMHWWGRADVALEFTRRNRSKHVEILPLTKPGQTVQISKGDGGEVLLPDQ